MKTKLNQTNFIALCVVLLTAFYSCKDDDHQFGINDLPEEVQIFADSYFPENEIEKAEISRDNAFYYGTQYALTLSDGIKIIYGTNYDYKISAPNGIPEAAKKLIGENMLAELLNCNPQANITYIETLAEHGREKMIKTADQKRYRITTNSEEYSIFTELLTVDEFPAQAIKFIEKYKLQDKIYEYSLMVANEGGYTYYRFYNYVDYDLMFDENGKWFQAKGPGYPQNILDDIIKNEIPEQIQETLNKYERYKGRSRTISCYKDGVYGFKFDLQSFLITADGQMLNSDEKADALIKQYYPSDAWTSREYQPEVASLFDYKYWYTYRNSAGLIYLYLDAAHQWSLIRTYSSPLGIPMAFIENELPAKIASYLKKNHTESKVSYIMRHPKGYGIRITNSSTGSLNFDTEGNPIRI